MTRSLILFATLVSTISAARANGGHLGELAGHAHWVGVAAVLGAAALAALAAKAKKRDGEPVADDAESDAEENPEGTAA